jgi:redox-sensing transcriptional repressor
MDKEISQAVVSRLPRYFRYLGELKASGVERISSQELSDIMKVTASQIRQDFNNFGGFGQQGYGYNVEYLYDEISKILGIDKKHQLIIIGTGNLGTALAGYTNFSTRGFVFKGAFDRDPALQGKMIGDVEIRPVEEIEDFIKKVNALVAAIDTKGIKIYDENGNQVKLVTWKNINLIGDKARDKAKERAEKGESLPGSEPE